MRKLFLSALAVAVVVGSASPADAATVHQRLRSVYVPAYCDMPAQHLHNGETLKKYQPREGSIDYYEAKPISVHLEAHGTQLLAQYGCTAGGVGWPEVLVVYNSHNHYVASLKLERYAKDYEHANATSWRRSGHTVKVTWTAYQGAGFDVHRHHSTLRLSHGKLRFG